GRPVPGVRDAVGSLTHQGERPRGAGAAAAEPAQGARRSCRGAAGLRGAHAQSSPPVAVANSPPRPRQKRTERGPNLRAGPARAQAGPEPREPPGPNPAPKAPHAKAHWPAAGRPFPRDAARDATPEAACAGRGGLAHVTRLRKRAGPRRLVSRRPARSVDGGAGMFSAGAESLLHQAREIEDGELRQFCSRLSQLLGAEDAGPEAVDGLQRLFLIVSATKYPRRGTEGRRSAAWASACAKSSRAGRPRGPASGTSSLSWPRSSASPRAASRKVG
uniref:Adaptor related protein complex 5 subunit zeta 1 n=1 Tax=Oryctolagus cuniculus TaxID=9986 RepID=A0A5F9C6X1_RABIT